MSRLFPELDGEQAARDGRAATRPAAGSGRPPSLERDEVCSLFGRMLGLSAEAPGPLAWGVAGVELIEEVRVGLRLEGPSGEQVSIWLVAPPRSEAFASTRAFSIVHGAEPLQPALGALLRRAARRMGEVPFEPLRRMASAAGAGEGGLAGDFARSIVHTYAGDRWAAFFEGHEMYRGYCQRQRGAIATVHHTEIECYYSNPPASGRVQGFFHYPSRVSEPEGDDGSFDLLTDLGDLDVIRGGTAKLDEALDGLARLPLAPELVVVQPGCTTLVTGDDIEGSADKLRRRVSVPVLNLALVPDPRREMIRLARGQAGFFEGQPRRGAINLVGLPRMPGSDEIVAFLEEMGLSINCWLLPDLDLSSFRRFNEAEACVLHGWSWNDAVYAELLEGTGARAIRPPSPFGVEGTRGFLQAVSGALGREQAFERVWAARHGEASEALERARGEARGYRLGFIGDEDELGGMLAPERMLGVPLVELIEGLGFGVDFLLRPGRGRAGAEAPWRAPGRGVRWFETPGELDGLLRGEGPVAYYTEMAFDRRLTRAGRNAFSLRDVAMGVGGAIATAERLLTVCRLPFYRLFGRLLGGQGGDLG